MKSAKRCSACNGLGAVDSDGLSFPAALPVFAGSMLGLAIKGATGDHGRPGIVNAALVRSRYQAERAPWDGVIYDGDQFRNAVRRVIGELQIRNFNLECEDVPVDLPSVGFDSLRREIVVCLAAIIEDSLLGEPGE